MHDREEAEAVWDEALGQLRLAMTRGTFDTWLRHSEGLGFEGDTLVVGVANQYGVDWLSNRLADLVGEVLSRYAKRPVSARFVVLPYGTKAGFAEQAELDDGQDEGPILEAVQTREVQLHGSGRKLAWTEFYIRIRTAFRVRALRRLKGAPLSVFLCLALHLNSDGVADPGIERIMRETGYSRSVVCSALAHLRALRLIERIPTGANERDRYRVRGYAWFGRKGAPALFEVDRR